MINYHFHDHRSSDGSEPLRAHCEAAVAAGVRHICITNHAEALGAGGRWVADFREMRDRFMAVRESVAECSARYPGLEIRLGAELEYRREWTQAFDRLTAAVPFDFVIGSVHIVDGMNVSGGPERDRFFMDRTQDEAYRRYFEEVEEMIAWGGFDVVGHFDLIKRFGHPHYGGYQPERYGEGIRRTLTQMAERGIGIEINTSGVGQAPGRAYPEVSILAWAREAGVPCLTLGSDSHSPRSFAQGLREGIEVASLAGWNEVATFEQRRPSVGLSIEALVGWASSSG